MVSYSCHVRNSRQILWTVLQSRWSSVIEAPFTEFGSSATLDVVISAGGPQTGSMTGFSDWAKYYGARPVWIWCINVHSMYLILCSTGNQCIAVSVPVSRDHEDQDQASGE